MTKRQGIVVCCGLVMAAQLSPAFPRGDDALTHEHAIELALANAPVLHAQLAAVESAQAQSVSAGRLPDPELIVGVENLPITGGDAYSLDRDFMTMRRIGVMQSFPTVASSRLSVSEPRLRWIWRSR